MANNRAYITCDVCKESVYLAKYYPSSGWYISITSERLFDTVGKFLEKHSNCNDNYVLGNTKLNIRFETSEKKELSSKFKLFKEK